jgi:hypothetical protein
MDVICSIPVDILSKHIPAIILIDFLGKFSR